MLVNEIATMTAVKVKEISTSTFTKVVRGMKRLTHFNLIERSPRKVAVCLAAWLLVNIAGYLLYHYAFQQKNSAFYQQGIAQARSLESKSGPFVLEKDILSLNVAIKEIQSIEDLKFAVILDHKNTILAHTNAELMNQKFEPLLDETPIEQKDGVQVFSAKLPDKTGVVGFFKVINFSDVEIGKVGLVRSIARLHDSLNQLRFLYVSGVLGTILLLAVALFVIDRSAKARALKMEADIAK
ncbi:MAG: hypothetical protein PVH44_08835, partial [Desulfobacterales bacterium]